MLSDIHDWYTSYLTDPSLQISITRCNNIALVLGNPINKTVISISSFMSTRKPFKSRILGNSLGNSVFLTQLLKLSHHTVSNTRSAFCIQAIHHSFLQIQFILNGEIDKVGIDQHSIRGSQGSVILEEEGRKRCLHVPRKLLCAQIFLLWVQYLLFMPFDSFMSHNFLHDGEFGGLLSFSHCAITVVRSSVT
nr:U3 small nucleolar RNA-associated protein 24 [Ipomoea batatas]